MAVYFTIAPREWKAESTLRAHICWTHVLLFFIHRCLKLRNATYDWFCADGSHIFPAVSFVTLVSVIENSNQAVLSIDRWRQDSNRNAVKRQKNCGIWICIHCRTDMSSICLSVKEPVDYQGRTFMHIPTDVGVNLRADEPPEKCFIPKRLIHTWTGHNKQLNAIRWFPKSAHLLLSCSMDHKIKARIIFHCLSHVSLKWLKEIC